MGNRNLIAKISNLKKLADLNNWELEDNCAYGESNGYLFSVTDGVGFKAVYTPLIGITHEEQSEVLRLLESLKKELKLGEFTFDNSVLYLQIKEKIKNASVDDINKVIQSVSEFLSKNQIATNSKCIFCSNDFVNKKVIIQGIAYYAHSGCFEKTINDLEEIQSELKGEQKNYMIGALGAFIGGLISSIPWILAILFFDRLFAALSILIALGATKAYQLFKGKLGPLTNWIILIVGILNIIIAQFIIYGIILFKYDVSINLDNFIYLFTNSEAREIILKQFKLSLFIGIIGFLPSFFNIRSSYKNQLPNIKEF